MTVLIKNMKMPENCDDCWALDEYGDYPVCQITEEQRGYNFRTREKRMDKCPLIEVPTPHGRLIDADELIKHDHQYYEYLSDEFYVLVRDIENAPTIIEAEEDKP